MLTLVSLTSSNKPIRKPGKNLSIGRGIYVTRIRKFIHLPVLMNGGLNIPICNEFNSMLGIPTINDFVSLRGQRKIVCLTAYTAPMANVLDPHCDLLLAGTQLGWWSTGWITHKMWILTR